MVGIQDSFIFTVLKIHLTCIWTLAQKTGQPCQAPSLDHGYFVPQKKTYLHEEWINYACEKGYKRVLGGWWATSKCLDGKWSHNPQCIGECSIRDLSWVPRFLSDCVKLELI